MTSYLLDQLFLEGLHLLHWLWLEQGLRQCIVVLTILKKNLFLPIARRTGMLYGYRKDRLFPIAIQRPDVPACTNCAVQLIKCCSWWWINDSLKHAESFNEKIKTIHKNLCIKIMFLHVITTCRVTNLLCCFEVKCCSYLEGDWIGLRWHITWTQISKYQEWGRIFLRNVSISVLIQTDIMWARSTMTVCRLTQHN